MKILFYNHTGKVSGAERVLLMILRNIDRTRFDSVVLCPEDGPLQSMVAASSLRTIPIETLNARFTWRPGLLLRYIASFVRMIGVTRRTVVAEAPDVIHANSVRAGLLMTIATTGLEVPVIWHVHDMLPRHPLSSAIRLVAFVFPRTQVLAVSNAVAQRFRGALMKWFPRRVHVTVIHNAVQLDDFYPDPLKRSETRRSLGFSHRELIIGIVGQLTARKGQLELIEAFARIAPEFADARLVIVGEAVFNRDYEYAERLHVAARTLGVAERVMFLGQREDVPEVTRALDLAVVNSRAEPFGLTVVEAMASGTPVLATAVDGIQEIIEHDRDGWLVRSADTPALVEALRRLFAAEKLRARLSTRASDSVRSRFGCDRFINDIQAFYHHLACASSMRESDQGQRLSMKLSAD